MLQFGDEDAVFGCKLAVFVCRRRIVQSDLIVGRDEIARLRAFLIQNRGKRRKAEADIAAAEARRDDAHVQLRGTVEAAYRRALALERSVRQLRNSVQADSNIPLLRRAMESGALSRPDYLEGVARYFALALREAQLRRDAELAKADVLAVYL